MSKDKRPEIEDELDMDLEDAEVDSSPSSVAKGAKKNFIMLVAILLVAVFAIYYILSGDKSTTVKDKKPIAEVSNKLPVVRPTATQDNDLAVSIPSLPPPPPLEAPKPPEPVVKAPEIAAPQVIQPPIMPNAPIIVDNKNDIYQGAMEARKRSSMMLKSGSDSSNALDKDTQKTTYLESDAYFIPSRTSASQQKATLYGKTDYLIAQGKIIDAVVETALNTDLAGTVRALVTRDVYAEAGKNILIPKGSRLIGVYPSTVTPGQDRVAIAWNRLIRPDGFDIMIDSPGVDKLGRAGVEGLLDNKYLEIFSNAVLLSSLNIAFAVAADKLTNAQAQTTATVNTGTGAVVTTSSGKSSDSAVQQSVTDVQAVGKKIVDDTLKTGPTITIDQGTLVKVFVNKDLIFPANMVQGTTRIIE